MYADHMLTDEEAAGIEQALRSGAVIHGRLLLKWVKLLLEDRRQRVEGLGYLRKRTEQAGAHFAGLSVSSRR